MYAKNSYCPPSDIEQLYAVSRKFFISAKLAGSTASVIHLFCILQEAFSIEWMYRQKIHMRVYFSGNEA